MHCGRPALVALLLLAMVAPPAAGRPALAHAYDLGRITITQSDLGSSSRFREMPVALRGIVAVPDGDGPFPVALIVHGSYLFCDAPLISGEVDPYPCPAESDLRQYAGFGYLAEALADAGYLALVPDLSAEFNNGYGFSPPGVRAIQILEAQLDALAAGTGFGAAVAGKADLDRLVVAGHSRGGPISIRYIRDDEWASHDPVALALLAPAAAPPRPRIPRTMPAALVAATCDGDVRLEQPLEYLDEQLPRTRPSITTTMVMEGGAHNAFSTTLGPDPVEVCDLTDVLPAEAQRARIADFLPRFFDLALAAVGGHP